MPRSGEDPRPPAFARWGQQVAFGFVGLGLLTIAIGWYGSSGAGAKIDGKTDLRAQLPYVLSGGALGLALVVIGVGLLVVHALRANRDRLEGLLLVLAERGEGAPAVPAGPLAPGLVIAGTASYHDPSCRLAAASTVAITVDEARELGLGPCRVCRPADVPAEPATV